MIISALAATTGGLHAVAYPGVSGSTSRVIYLEKADGKVWKSLRADVRCLAFSPENEAGFGSLVIAGNDGRIWLWDLSSKWGTEPVSLPWQGPRDIAGLSVSQDGLRLAVACGDASDCGGVVIIDMKSGSELGIIRHVRGASCVAFAPDDRRIWFGAARGLFEADAAGGTGELREKTVRAPSLIAFLPDGKRIWWPGGVAPEIDLRDFSAVAHVPGSWTLLGARGNVVKCIELSARRPVEPPGLRGDARAMLAILTKHLPAIDAIEARVKLAETGPYSNVIKHDLLQAEVSVAREESWPGGFRVASYPAITLYVRPPSTCKLVVAAGGALPGYESFGRDNDKALLQLRSLPDYPAVLGELARLEGLPPPGKRAQGGEPAPVNGVQPSAIGGRYEGGNYLLELWGRGEVQGFRYAWGSSGALGSESMCYEGTWTLVPPNVLKLRVLKRESDIEVGFHDRDSSKAVTDFVKEAVVLDGGWAIVADGNGRILFGRG